MRDIKGIGALALAGALLLGACGDDDTAAPTSGEAAAVTTTSAPEDDGGEAVAPDEGVADITEELTAGGGIFVGSPEGRAGVEGYTESEYVAAGTATEYTADGELAGDGQWTLTPGDEADYRTRVVIRRPEEPDDFSGVVILEWMNVSGGVDADPEWSSLKEEIGRQGHVWIGVSAQMLGIEGGEARVTISGVEGSEAAGQGLKSIDPERYGSLTHPGDSFAYDIYSQIARAVRDGIPAMDDLEPEHLIAAGESQSAAALVTYINGFQPESKAFDGFFVHSRGAAGLPLPAAGEAADIAGSIGGTPTILRTDVDAPIIVLQAENDVTGVLRGGAARQDDSDTLRWWEVAGTAHADKNLVGESTAAVIDCGAPINDGPLHVVAKAALRHLVNWVVDGEAPPEAPRLELVDDSTAVRDEDGIAVGGVRTPPVDVPAEILSGEPGPSGEIICILSGSTLPMPPERLAQLYPSVDDYEAQYEAAVDEAIDAGFVLDEDREAILAYARPELIVG